MPAPAERTVLIDPFLTAEGFTGEAASVARRALEEAGVTRAGKVGFSSVKLELAREVLERQLARACDRPQCRELLAHDGRRLVNVPRANCEVCGGSNNQASTRTMLAACADAGVSRILVVGGTPNQWEALEQLLDRVELRFVDGTRGTNQRVALQNCAWTDLVIVWAPTPLAHRVSDLYGADVCIADHVQVNRRGIEALANAVTAHLRRAPGRRVSHR